MSAKFNLDAFLGKVSKVGDTVLDFQMKRALVQEQRDRTSVETGVYIPGPYDYQQASYEPEPAPAGLNIGGMELQPLHLALGAVLLIAVMR